MRQRTIRPGGRALPARAPARLELGSHLRRGEGQGPERFAAQYWRANSRPSDRYVLAAPGTLRFRLAARRLGVRQPLSGGRLGEDRPQRRLRGGGGDGRRGRRPGHPPTASGPAAWSRRPAPAGLRRSGQRLGAARAGAGRETSRRRAFVLHADPEALAALCAQAGRWPTAGAVTRAALAGPGRSASCCSARTCPTCESGDEEHRQLGSSTSTTSGSWCPVTLDGADGPRRDRPADALPVRRQRHRAAAGREIYGFSKLLARIDMPVPLPGRGFEPATGGHRRRRTC